MLLMHYEHGSAFMKSWFTQLCEEFFSSFFYKGARKGDVVSLEKLHEKSVDDEV